MASDDKHTPENGPEGGSLGKLAKSVNADPRETRAKRYGLQRQAARIMGRERVRKCRWTVAQHTAGATIHKGQDRARFSGLQTCGSVWHCPVCSAVISGARRREMNDALAAARAQGLVPVLITLTFAHGWQDDLAAILDALKAAKKHWHNSRTYKAHKRQVVGLITATEVTHGAHGWHPHLHLLAFLKPDAAIEDLEGPLADAWLDALARVGLSGTLPYAFTLQDAHAAGQYVAKWGAAEEMALGQKKTDGGAHPFQLLERAEFDPYARRLFFEYATAFKGRRQLQWTPGLKDALGVSVLSDEEAAEVVEEEAEEVVARIPEWRWKKARGFGRVRILEAAEDGGGEAVEALISGPLPDNPET